jgi:predicted AlkP superfamily pyrophosphatase or phosphodiesterase
MHDSEPPDFAEIPHEIRRRVAAGERVLLILLDAFGLEFVHRHEDHPLLRRLQVIPLRSQFPSTTTAHVTTVHRGVPVHEHGLYEWNVFEPALGRVICPLRFNLAGSEHDGDLSGALAPDDLLGGPTFYEALGVPSIVAQPATIADSAFTRLATRGARRLGFAGLTDGVEAVIHAFRSSPELRFGFLYWDAIDRTGHERGPGSREFHAASRFALDVLETTLGDLPELTVLITADHGQVDVAPQRVDYLDELWPGLWDRLSQPRPAGSSRDVFLHVRALEIDEVIDELSARLGERAEVHRAADLFPTIGPRLRARLGDVVVLPAPGRQAWLGRTPSNERWFRGHHGGLDDAETAVYLAELLT